MTMRFLVINCENSRAWSERTFADMFTSKLSREGDEWITVNVATGDAIPPADQFQGIVITGSHFNVRDQMPWYGDLCQFIRDAADRGAPRIYGGCFGCQIVGHALGGQVDKNPSGNFVLRAENIVFDNVLMRDVCCGTVDCYCDELKLIESHGDCVCILPPGAKRLAWSRSCANEMYVAGTANNIFCCQSHPEFELDYCIKDRILPSVIKSGRLTEDQQLETLQTFDAFTAEDSIRMLNIISAFLHHSEELTTEERCGC